MSKDFDKILKENIAAVFLPLAEKYLGIRIIRSEELKDKLQTTLEKEPDFLRIVETETGEKFLLQLEFQSADEEGMIYRMQEYYGILRKKHRLPVRQFVIYLGQKASRMQTRLAPEEVFEGFTLQSLREYSHRSLVSSEIPEEIILAILSDFEDRKPVEVLQDILEKLKQVSGQEISLRKYVRQLSLLARLRNLTKETQKQINEMGITYNVTEDFLYQQGVEKGKKEIIIRMLRDKALSTEKIAELTEVKLEYVKQLMKELKRE